MAKEIFFNFSEDRIYAKSISGIAGLKLGDTVIAPGTGRRFGYGRIGGAFSRGQIVKSAGHTECTVGTTNQATSAAAVGTDRLVDTGAFDGKEWIRGALGVITGGTGIGQAFYVKKVIDADTIQVVVTHDLSGFIKNGKWKTALDTTSTYDLSLPGVFYAQDSATSHDDEGISQVEAATADVGKYVYIPRSGRIVAEYDASGNALVAGGRVKKTSAGLIEGMPSTLTIAALDAAVGTSVTTDIGGTTDGLVWVNAQIPDPPHNFDKRFAENPFNFVDIGPN